MEDDQKIVSGKSLRVLREGPNSCGRRGDKQEAENAKLRQRVCLTPRCETRLSSANKERICFLCQKRGLSMHRVLNPRKERSEPWLSSLDP